MHRNQNEVDLRINKKRGKRDCMCRQLFQECLLLMGTECREAAWMDSKVEEEFTFGIVNANSSLYAVKIIW